MSWTNRFQSGHINKSLDSQDLSCTNVAKNMTDGAHFLSKIIVGETILERQQDSRYIRQRDSGYVRQGYSRYVRQRDSGYIRQGDCRYIRKGDSGYVRKGDSGYVRKGDSGYVRKGILDT